MSDFVSGMIGAVVGAAATALASGIKDFLAAHFKRKSNAEYLAIRVVAVMDRYVEGCASVAGDDGLCEGRPNEQGMLEIQIKTPTFDVQNLDVDWKSIPAGLMFRLLSFPDLIEAASEKIGADFEFGGGDNSEGIFTRQLEYAKLGLQAADLSQEVRKKYGIPTRQMKDWNAVKFMRDTKDRLLEAELEAEKRRAVALGTPLDPVGGSGL